MVEHVGSDRSHRGSPLQRYGCEARARPTATVRPCALRARSPTADRDAAIPPHRYTAALAARDRGRLAGPLGGRGHLPRPEPHGPAGRRLRPSGRPPEALRARHVPLPVRRRAPRRPPARLHRHRRVRPLQADDRPQRHPHHGLRRLRPARRAVRRPDRAAPPGDHRGQHRQHARASCAGSASATTRAAAWPPPTWPSTGGRSGSSCRSSAAGTTPRPTGPDRSPSSRPSSTAGTREPGPGTNPAGGRWAELDDVERRQRRRRPPPRLPARGAGQLVPGPRHGAGQRGGHRRRSLRAGQLPRVPAPAEAVDDADHRLRRPADRRPRPASTGPSRSS